MREIFKVLNGIIDIAGVKYFRNVAYAQEATFSKKQVFLKLKIIVLRNSHIVLTKVTRFSESTSKIKVMLALTLFLILMMLAFI